MLLHEGDVPYNPTDCLEHASHFCTEYTDENSMRCYATHLMPNLPYSSALFGIGMGPPGESSFLAVNTSTPVSVTSKVCSTQR